eukprot:m.16261 g.16261  ORF g.16261 m.16261 type:complete len:253 (-) comp3117_c0_seq2:87-845(-)
MAEAAVVQPPGITEIAISTGLWAVLLGVLTVFNPLQPPGRANRLEWANQIQALLHCLFSLALGARGLWDYGLYDEDAFGLATTRVQYLAMLCSLGYFICDGVWCIVRRDESPAMFAHHAVSLSSLLYGVLSAASGREIVIAIVLGEISNPMYKVRWALREYGLGDSLAAKINDFLFFGVFIVARVFFGTPYIYLCVTSPKPTVAIKVGGAMLLLVSYFWAAIMLKMILSPKKSKHPKASGPGEATAPLKKEQ